MSLYLPHDIVESGVNGVAARLPSNAQSSTTGIVAELHRVSSSVSILRQEGGVAQGRVDILGFQIRIVGQDRFACLACR